MNQLNYLLSVCIPTYNRLRYLKESLDVLLPQAQHLGVEVCVSDNHSSDETLKYLETMSGRYSCLQVVVQSENIGLDKNMAAVISMGKGRYIYPLGDDDVLPEEALATILNEVNADTDVLILNGWHTDAFMSPRSLHLPPDLQNRQFVLPETAFTSLWDKMPFGSFVAYRGCFSVKHFQRFIGTSHAYTGAVWDVLSEKYQETGVCKIKCMAIPTVLLRGAEKSWRKDAARIMLLEIPLWFRMMAECYQLVVEQILNDYLKSNMRNRQLLQYRATGQLDSNLADGLKAVLSVKQLNKINRIVKIPIFIAQLYCNTNEVLRRIYKWMKKQINRE